MVYTSGINYRGDKNNNNNNKNLKNFFQFFRQIFLDFTYQNGTTFCSGPYA